MKYFWSKTLTFLLKMKWWKGFLLEYPYSKGVLAGRIFEAAVFIIDNLKILCIIKIKQQQQKDKKSHKQTKKSQTNPKKPQTKKTTTTITKSGTTNGSLLTIPLSYIL